MLLFKNIIYLKVLIYKWTHHIHRYYINVTLTKMNKKENINHNENVTLGLIYFGEYKSKQNYDKSKRFLNDR